MGNGEFRAKLEKNRDVTSRLGGGILDPKTRNFIKTANRTVTDFSRLLKGQDGKEKRPN
jgi:hypothetical protein